MNAEKKYKYHPVTKSSFWYANWLTVRMVLESKMVMLFVLLSTVTSFTLFTAWLITVYGYTKLKWIEDDLSAWDKLKHETKMIIIIASFIVSIVIFVLMMSTSTPTDPHEAKSYWDMAFSVIGPLFRLLSIDIVVSMFTVYSTEVYDDYNGEDTGLTAILSDSTMLWIATAVIVTTGVIIPIVQKMTDSPYVLIGSFALESVIYLLFAGQIIGHLYTPEPPKVTVHQPVLQ